MCVGRSKGFFEMRFITTLSLMVVSFAAVASAQPRRTDREPAPAVDFSVEQMSGDEPFRRVLALRAAAPADIVADRRLLYFEVRVPDSRRVLRCEHPDRRRASRSTVRLEAGERWAEWIDLREYCWGRTLDALRGGAELAAFYRVGPRQTLGPHEEHIEPVAAPADPEPLAPIRILLRNSDARRARDLTFRVRVLTRDGRVRAYVRSDHVRFRVRGPEGNFDCGMAHGQGAAAPDLFGWLTPRSGPSFVLDPSFYCPDSFGAAGIYEVVPMIDLEQSGERWGFTTPTGTFTGPPALVRIREGDRGHESRSPPGGDPE